MLKRPINVLIALIATLLSFVAIMPLFGYDLVIHKFALLPIDRYAGDVTHLVLTRSAAFGTLAFFCINFLRRKRPWSSVAPMLVFCNFFLLFGLIMVAQGTLFSGAEAANDWRLWGLLGMIGLLSTVLYLENKAESNRIFKDRW
jgi:hypothetical protein